MEILSEDEAYFHEAHFLFRKFIKKDTPNVPALAALCGKMEVVTPILCEW